MSCNFCERARKFLPTPVADRLRAIERQREKERDRAFKAAKRSPLPGEVTNRVLDRGNR